MSQRLGGLCKHLQSWTDGALLPIAVLSVALLLPGIELKAQVVNGINGTVTDSSGAVIQGAHVTATNVSTSVASSAATSSDGAFTIVGLIPGSYSLTVEAQGFKKVETNVTVEVARMSTVTLRMEPGSVTQSVVVKASAITLETTSPVIGTTLEPTLVKQAPIEIIGMARQIDSFMYLAPGVQGGSSAHYINGGVTFENETDFNGVPVAFVAYEGNQTNINPPYEAVNEFRVNSSTFDPRFGQGQGAVTYSMASGTNRLHGDGFEIVRNQDFDAPGLFPVRFGPSGNPLPAIDQQNNFGFSVGGPVYLPKVYNGKNKLFFHFSDDWFRQNLALYNIGTVPTAAMKQGDFSSFVNSAGVMIPIYDPQTGQPFPGNKIPSNRFSPLSQSILPSIPAPNRAGTNFGLQNNMNPVVPSIPIRQNLWAYTIDYNLTQSQSVHFSQWRDTVSEPSFWSAPIVPTSNELQSAYDSKNAGSVYLVNYTYSLRPTLVMTAGANYVRDNIVDDNEKTGVSFPGVAGSTTFPYIGFDGQNAPTSWGVSDGNGIAFQQNGGLTQRANRQLGVVAVNNWMWVKGRNTFNFGGQVRRTFQDLLACDLCGGHFAFSQRTTSIPNSSDPNFGLDGSSFASFLLGEANASARVGAREIYPRNKAWAAYLQDQIKVNSRLTIDAGVRWDVEVPWTEEYNRIVFVSLLTDPGTDPVLNIPGATRIMGNCAGCAGITRAAIHWRYFEPRAGFAYMLNSKTSIRSSFYITTLDGGAYEYGTGNRAFVYSSLLTGQFGQNPSESNIPAYGNWDTQSLPFPNPVPFSPSIAHGGIIRDLEPSSSGLAPYVQAWNFSVERELPWNMFLTVAYVGNHGIHLPVTLNQINQTTDAQLAEYGSLFGALVTSPAAQAAGIKIPYPSFVSDFGGAATVNQALKPYPQYAGTYSNLEQDGKAMFNALQVQAEKRFSNGLSYLGDLMISRNIANCNTGSQPFSANGDDSRDEAAEYGPSFNDQLYNFHFVTSYDLPIGLGKKFLNSKGLKGALLGGWQVSAILTYAGGFPFGPTNGYDPFGINGQDRPNLVPGGNPKNYSYGLSKNYFDKTKTGTPPTQFTTNAFVNTTPWQIGSAARAYWDMRTPPLRTENFSFVKNFSIKEHLQATLRFDYFNLFNRTQLQAPDNNSLDTTFGQITNLSSQLAPRTGQATFRLEF
jgi:hypothetical protein